MPLARTRRFILSCIQIRERLVHGRILSAEATNAWIAGELRQRRPWSAGKLGSVELAAIRHSRSGATIWDGRQGQEFHANAGVFPPRPEMFQAAAERILRDLTDIDLMAVWFNRGESAIVNAAAPQSRRGRLRGLEPFYHAQPWSAELAGRRVTVVTPFARSVATQYERRQLVWERHPLVLPEFALATVASPLSAALVPPRDATWLEALQRMEDEVLATRPEIVLIGCGAWSLPLVASMRRRSISAIHLGGGLQVLFGILGSRWQDSQDIAALRTEAWTRPLPEETPEKAHLIEGACYW